MRIRTMPLVTTTRGAEGELGKSPAGCPEYITRVWSSVISDKYFIVSRNYEEKVQTQLVDIYNLEYNQLIPENYS